MPLIQKFACALNDQENIHSETNRSLRDAHDESGHEHKVFRKPTVSYGVRSDFKDYSSHSHSHSHSHSRKSRDNRRGRKYSEEREDESFTSSSSRRRAWEPDRKWESESIRQEERDMKRKQDLKEDYGIRMYLETSKKGQKETFYCELCRVELNSRETKISHQDGTKHQDRLLKIRVPDRNHVIKRISNPLTTKKKQPMRLEAKIMKCREPIVGLRYVDEFICESNDEMEPYYECSLCDSQGEPNSMFNHLLGKNHRSAFFQVR